MEKFGKLAPTVIKESQKNDWKAFTARRKRSKSSSLESVEKSFKKAIQTLEETKNSERTIVPAALMSPKPGSFRDWQFSRKKSAAMITGIRAQ